MRYELVLVDARYALTAKKKFEDEVNKRMKKGWIPKGGVCYGVDKIGEQRILFCQAMIKEE